MAIPQLFTHLPIDLELPDFWLFRVKLLLLLKYKFFCGHRILFLGGTYLGVELLGQTTYLVSKCVTSYHKCNGLAPHGTIPQFSPSEVWVGSTKFFVQGLTRLKSRGWPGWVLIWGIWGKKTHLFLWGLSQLFKVAHVPP